MVARPSHVKKVASRITVRCREKPSDRANYLLEKLEKEGYEFDKINIGDHPRAGQDVISMLDLDGPFFHDISAAQYQAFKDFFSRLGDSGVMWITEMCQMSCKDPRYGQTLGLIRIEYKTPGTGRTHVRERVAQEREGQISEASTVSQHRRT